MSSFSTKDYSPMDSETDVIEFKGGCTKNYLSNKNADDSIQSYEGEPLMNKEWISNDTKQRIKRDE